MNGLVVGSVLTEAAGSRPKWRGKQCIDSRMCPLRPAPALRVFGGVVWDNDGSSGAIAAFGAIALPAAGAPWEAGEYHLPWRSLERRVQLVWAHCAGYGALNGTSPPYLHV